MCVKNKVSVKILSTDDNEEDDNPVAITIILGTFMFQQTKKRNGLNLFLDTREEQTDGQIK